MSTVTEPMAKFIVDKFVDAGHYRLIFLPARVCWRDVGGGQVALTRMEALREFDWNPNDRQYAFAFDIHLTHSHDKGGRFGALAAVVAELPDDSGWTCAPHHMDHEPMNHLFVIPSMPLLSDLIATLQGRLSLLEDGELEIPF